ncbi:hypothetical protein [Clostridium tertium]|uniref:hypothetical protein n=1 Tax=Clostridium tertium TaxID=1559 RepID=UPI0012E869EF
MSFLKSIFTILVLMVLISLLFKYSFWAVNSILILATLLFLGDVFYYNRVLSK